jgi:hypothetical protein
VLLGRSSLYHVLFNLCFPPVDIVCAINEQKVVPVRNKLALFRILASANCLSSSLEVQNNTPVFPALPLNDSVVGYQFGIVFEARQQLLIVPIKLINRPLQVFKFNRFILPCHDYFEVKRHMIAFFTRCLLHHRCMVHSDIVIP